MVQIPLYKTHTHNIHSFEENEANKQTKKPGTNEVSEP